AMLPYYPDQLTAYFAFELSDSLLSAVRSGSAAGLLTGFLRLEDTLPAYRWSPFLTNHDQTRALTALGGDVARARIAATLLLTLPGLPFIYYGEEIGMTGELVPLSTTSPQVAAYLRRTNRRAVLVVANLGGSAVSGVAIASAERALPPRAYTPRNLLGGPDGAKLHVGADGRLREYVPVA